MDIIAERKRVLEHDKWVAAQRKRDSGANKGALRDNHVVVHRPVRDEPSQTDSSQPTSSFSSRSPMRRLDVGSSPSDLDNPPLRLSFNAARKRRRRHARQEDWCTTRLQDALHAHPTPTTSSQPPTAGTTYFLTFDGGKRWITENKRRKLQTGYGAIIWAIKPGGWDVEDPIADQPDR
jgi:hypothetical protein